MVDTVLEKKGGDILLLDIRDQAIFTDYFLICNGESVPQLRAMAEGIAEDGKKKGNVIPWGIEGAPESGWMLVDFGDVVVHIFSPEQRAYYNLEELWRGAHIVLRMP